MQIVFKIQGRYITLLPQPPFGVDHSKPYYPPGSTLFRARQEKQAPPWFPIADELYKK